MRTGLTRLSRLLRLPWPELLLLLEAQVNLVAASYAVATRPRGELIAPLRGAARDVAQQKAVPGLAVAVAEAVRRAASFGILRATCLPRSVALHRMLARRGIPGVLCVGVRRRGSVLEAHAWVECGGQPLGENRRHVESFARLEHLAPVTRSATADA